MEHKPIIQGSKVNMNLEGNPFLLHGNRINLGTVYS